MAIFTVSKTDLSKFPDFKTEVDPICEAIHEAEHYLCFTPRPGFLVAFGVLLTDKGISYQLDFEPNHSPLDDRQKTIL